MKVKSVIKGFLLTVLLVFTVQITAQNEETDNNELFTELMAKIPPREVACHEIPERFTRFTEVKQAISVEAILRDIIIPLEDSLKTKIIVTSGYRSHTHNKRVGGVPNSYHTKGRAIDFVLPKGKNKEAIAIIKSLNIPTIELIDEGNHIHIAI